MMKKRILATILILTMILQGIAVYAHEENKREVILDFDTQESMPKTLGGSWSIEERTYVTYQDNDFEKNSGDLQTVFGIWNVKNGKYVQNELSTGAAARTVLPDFFEDFEMELDVKPLSDDTKLMLFFACASIYDVSIAQLSQSGTSVTVGENEFKAETSIEKNKEYHIKLSVKDKALSLYLDGELVMSQENLVLKKGQIGVGCWNSKIEIDNFKVVAPDRLGNGKKLVQKGRDKGIAYMPNSETYPVFFSKIASDSFIVGEAGNVMCADNEGNGYYFAISNDRAYIKLKDGKVSKTLGEVKFKPLGGRYYEIKSVNNNGELSLFVDGKQLLSVRDKSLKDGLSGIFCEKLDIVCDEMKASDLLADTDAPDKSFSVDSFSDISDSRYYEAVGIATALDIMAGYSDGKFRGEEKITRAEFSDIIYRMQKKGAGSNSSYTVPEDVNEETSYKSQIIAAINDGYLKTDSKKANPTDYIKTEDAYFAMLKILGAEPLTVNGKIISTAQSFELTDKVLSKNGELTFYGAAQMIFNTLCTQMISFGGIKGNDVELTRGETLLEKVHKVSKCSGNLKANKYINAYGDNPEELLENQVLIGSETFICKRDVSEFVGCDVIYYVFEPKTESDREIIWINSYKCDKTTIWAERISEDTENNRIVYYEYSDSASTKKIKLSDDTKIVYNGLYYKTVKDAEEDIFNIVDGNLVLVDNNSDLHIDFIFVNSARTVIIDAISSANKLIYTKFTGEAISFDEEDINIIIWKNNRKIGFGDLKQGNVLSVFEPKNKEGYTTVNVSAISSHSGIVKGITEDSIIIGADEFYVGNTVDISDYKISEYITVYFDYNNKIAYIEKRADEDYAYLVDVKIDDEEEDRLFLKMFTISNGKGNFEIGEKVTVYFSGEKIRYSQRNIGANSYSVLKSVIEDILDASITYDDDLKPEKYGVLIKYKLNNENKVNEIHFEKDRTNCDLPDGDDTFACYYDSEKAGGKSYYYSGIINSKYRITQNTKTITLSGDCFDIDGFRIVPAGTLSWDEYYDARIYDVNENFEAKVLVVYDNDDGFDRPVNIIRSVTREIDEDDNAYICFKVYENGESKYIKAMDEELVCDNAAAEWFKNSGTRIKDLKPGDIFIYDTNSEGYVNWFAVIFKNREQPFYATSPRGWYWGTIPSTDMTLAYTGITKRTSEIFVFDSNNYSRPVLNSGGKYYLYDSKKGTLEKASFDDVMAGDKAVIIWKTAVLGTVVIYR